MTIEKLLLALAAGFSAVKLTQQQQKSIIQPVLDLTTTFSQDNTVISDQLNTWVPPASADPYLYLLNSAEIKYGLPENLLVRVAYQESHFRNDIINGNVISKAGAVGIMQLVPKWHPNVDPLNVADAIDYAAGYLKRLFNQTGTWRMALAAYNWGIGNLNKKGFNQAPDETKRYVKEISSDVLKGID